MNEPTPNPDRPAHARADRLRLPLVFDAAAMRAAVEALGLRAFIYYDVMPLRVPAHLVDPSRPRPPPTADYADGSWTEWLDTSALTASPCLSAVVDEFRSRCEVTLVRLLRLEAGAEVKEHTDPTLGLDVPNSVVRLTIPIRSDDRVQFFLNDVPVPMQPGECWYLRLCDRHRIVNASAEERVNMTIDVVPNDWLRSLLREAERDTLAAS